MIAEHGFSLTHVPLFEGLSMDTLAPLLASVRTVSLEKNEYLFRQGERGKEMYIIKSGSLRIWKENNDGHKLELAVLGQHEVVGELEIIDGKPRSANVQALEPSELMALARDALFNHLGSHPGMAVHLMTILSERLRTNNEMQLQLHSEHKPAARVAQLLLLLCGDDGNLLHPPFDVNGAAFILNMEPEALERILKQLDGQGLIRRSADTMKIQNQTSLRQLIG
ncbi:MAG TPA: Crp/Fnr family transcriptional regulator [Aggregatilineales bacterium]|nr:Crp/Fnr family transcriptional regulator [Aggregatilineales bacterium]